MINLEDFKKVELKIAKILEAERVVDADKLLRLKVTLGSEERVIVSGIAQSYSSEELIGREVVIIANLEPRTIRGIESQGMLLAASDGEKIVLLMPEKEIAPGSVIK